MVSCRKSCSYDFSKRNVHVYPKNDPNSGKQCAEPESSIYMRPTQGAVHREPRRLTKFLRRFHHFRMPTQDDPSVALACFVVAISLYAIVWYRDPVGVLKPYHASIAHHLA